MRARYSKISEGRGGKLICLRCKKFDWFIVVESVGAKQDFYICMGCGHKVGGKIY